MSNRPHDVAGVALVAADKLPDGLLVKLGRLEPVRSPVGDSVICIRDP